MKLKTLLLVVASSTVQADLMQTNETFAFALEDQSRGLQQSRNQDCNISGEISCKVIGDNRDCRDLDIRKDKCKMLPIRMNFTFCNNQQLFADKIVILPSLSFAGKDCSLSHGVTIRIALSSNICFGEKSRPKYA